MFGWKQGGLRCPCQNSVGIPDNIGTGGGTGETWRGVAKGLAPDLPLCQERVLTPTVQYVLLSYVFSYYHHPM